MVTLGCLWSNKSKKSQGFFPLFDKNKTDHFSVIEKWQKPFVLRFFLTEIIVQLQVTFLFLFVSLAELQPFVLVYPGLTSIFNITTALQVLVVIFSGRKFQNIPPWQVKKFISSRVRKLLRLGAAIFPVPRATSQIRKRRGSPYSLL